MADGITLLIDKTLEMLVVLRMKPNFMVFMWVNYFLEMKALQLFNATFVVPGIEKARENSKRH